MKKYVVTLMENYIAPVNSNFQPKVYGDVMVIAKTRQDALNKAIIGETGVYAVNPRYTKEAEAKAQFAKYTKIWGLTWDNHGEDGLELGDPFVYVKCIMFKNMIETYEQSEDLVAFFNSYDEELGKFVYSKFEDNLI